MSELNLDAIGTRYREYASACDRGYRSGLFVAAVADDVPALLAEVERLTEQRDEARTTAASMTLSLKRVVEERTERLLRYSEWLDGQGIVLGEKDSGDRRSHAELVRAFLSDGAA